MTHFILLDAKRYQISYLTFHLENLEDRVDRWSQWSNVVTQWFDTSKKKVKGVSVKSFKFKFSLCWVTCVKGFQPFVNHLWAL